MRSLQRYAWTGNAWDARLGDDLLPIFLLGLWAWVFTGTNWLDYRTVFSPYNSCSRMFRLDCLLLLAGIVLSHPQTTQMMFATTTDVTLSAWETLVNKEDAYSLEISRLFPFVVFPDAPSADPVWPLCRRCESWWRSLVVTLQGLQFCPRDSNLCSRDCEKTKGKRDVMRHRITIQHDK